ncbi:hypothetical protein [Bacillus salipaludis]|uniref:hypothetical protein n=1 Tax=Bacillus salipaludis TaxID=2547811 RepID=UPI002E236FD4|nr:hypothetical protein [Bacillus salipaludis]
MNPFYIRTGIRIAMEHYHNTDKKWMVGELLDLLFATGTFDNIEDTEEVLKIFEEEEATVLLPFIVQSLQYELMELKEKLWDEGAL